MENRAFIGEILISPVPEDAKLDQRGGFEMVSIPSANLVAGEGLETVDGIKDRYKQKLIEVPIQ